MTPTTFSRKLDSQGRIMIPVKLREDLNLRDGLEYTFFTHSENGEEYICIKCPRQIAPASESQIKNAIALLEKLGYTISR